MRELNSCSIIIRARSSKFVNGLEQIQSTKLICFIIKLFFTKILFSQNVWERFNGYIIYYNNSNI